MRFKQIIYLALVALPMFSEAQKNKKTESEGISEKDLKSEAYFVEGMKNFIAETYDKAIPLFKTCQKNMILD